MSAYGAVWSGTVGEGSLCDDHHQIEPTACSGALLITKKYIKLYIFLRFMP